MSPEFLFDAPDSSYAVAIRNDDRTVWAYLHTAEGVVSDVWLYNLQEAPPEINPDRDRPPLNAARYCSAETRPIVHYPDDVSLHWRYDAGELVNVEILVDDLLLACLAPGRTPAWSRFAARDGPCALCLK